MKKNLLKSMLMMIVFCFFVTSNVFAEKKISLNTNGENSKITPIVVNGSSMLPLRDTLNIFRCDEISWDKKTSTILFFFSSCLTIHKILCKNFYTNP